jgi:hypothetical protein
MSAAVITTGIVSVQNVQTVQSIRTIRSRFRVLSRETEKIYAKGEK